jgi:ribosomal protein S18 acetylase RimI-like enzyme
MTTAQVNSVDDLLQREARVSLRNRFTSPDQSPAGAARNAQVQTAGSNDQPWLLATLMLAFSTDPAVRWMYPAPETYLEYFPQFVSAFGGRAFESGTAHFIGDVQAVALWLPPDIQPDEEPLMNLFQRTVPEQNQQALFSMFEQMGDYHPHEPHWYLPLIGVDPIQQRKGYGSMLLEHALKVCDEEQMPAYLESSNPENIPLYQRHGFEVLGIIQAGTSPPVTPMLRHPR